MKHIQFKRAPRTLALLAGIAVLSAGRFAAAADVVPDGPDIAFTQQDGDVVQAPANNLVTVCANLSDNAADIRSATISGANRSASVVFSPGMHTACLQLYWSTRYAATGDYTFQATLSDVNGHQTVKTLTLHLVK